jgi:hypothetical protein
LSRDRKRVVRERIHAKKGRRRLRTAGRAVR